MPHFLVRFSYTPETWAKLIEAPEDRRKEVETFVEAVGGRLEGFWYAFGQYDGYCVIEAPDNVSQASIAVDAIGSGALKSSEAVVLLTVDEMMQALSRARELRFRAPGRAGDQTGSASAS